MGTISSFNIKALRQERDSTDYILYNAAMGWDLKSLILAGSVGNYYDN